MFVDTHCHIEMEKSEEYIRSAFKENVKILITASEDYKSSLDNKYISKEYSSVFCVVGVHPLNVDNFNLSDINLFRDIIKDKNVVGIGEIGLDYHYSKDNKEKQREVFCEFLKLAEEYDLPVVVHSREATKDTIDILKKFKVKGIIHCFSGSLEVAREYIKLGFYLGIGGVLTFKNSNLGETLKNISISNLVLETDAPYLAPHPYRGTKNESKYIPIIAKKLSEVKGLDIGKVMDITTNNAKQIFDI